jgi:hypothetical protein
MIDNVAAVVLVMLIRLHAAVYIFGTGQQSVFSRRDSSMFFPHDIIAAIVTPELLVTAAAQFSLRRVASFLPLNNC